LGLRESGASANYGAYANPAYDAVLGRARQTVDPAAHTALLLEAEQILLDDNGIAPLFFPAAPSLVNPRVSGGENNPMNLHPFELLCTKEAGR
jgi:oligopeptide transport system substrate-binding protein